MKKTKDEDEMLPHYDFKDAVQGKYYKAYREGHQTTIHKEDGTTEVRYFTVKDGAVMLDPDIRKVFPTSEAVNKALRSLLPHAQAHE